MSGMCDRCRMDAALPDSDLCASCLEEHGQVVQLSQRVRRFKTDCPFGTPWCHGHESDSCCPDCAEFNLGPKAAA